MSDLAAGKKAAAIKAVNDFVKVTRDKIYDFTTLFNTCVCVCVLLQDNQKLGIGSGSTIVFAVERLGKKS